MPKTYTISTVIRVALMALFIMAIFGIAGRFHPYVTLTGPGIFEHLQLWRLLSWPVGLSFGGLIIGSIAFSQPGEELESMYGSPKFGLLIGSVALLTAAIHLACYSSSADVDLAGMATPGIFVMVGYFYLFPASSVKIFFFNVRTTILLSLMVAFVLVKSVIVMQAGAGPLVFFSEGGTGIVVGFLWFHLAYQKYPVLLGAVAKITGLFQRAFTRRGTPTKLRVIEPKRGSRRQTVPDDDPADSGEERLNAILEKIGSKGYDSLTNDERQFLDEYSERL